MIGLLVRNAEREVVREFFELFKTPWEFYRDYHEYDVLICSGYRPPGCSAKLVLLYGSEQTEFDRAQGIETSSTRKGAVLVYKNWRIPLFGSCLTFNASTSHELIEQSAARPAACEIDAEGRRLVRLGFNLFQEISALLTRGQPQAHATIPALELHIALLRDLILGHSISLVEIPPVPEGSNFIVCLTHDVDHVGIRNHRLDHTMFGFIYRATIGSLRDVARGRKSVREMLKNWMAALSLPLVYLGLARDFWYQFDRYVEIENGLTSTFFVIPKKGEPGQAEDGSRPSKRAAKYDAAKIAGHLQRATAAGHEVGVHGIDAWRSKDAGREEFERISNLVGKAELGIRMHWLFFDENSTAVLEEAGFSYDSTVGYNGAVGYRAGTTQVFKPLNTALMLELPMHVMDTALFYPSHMNLSPKQAHAEVEALMDNAARFGGVLTINWHDRSIAPERLWDGFYVQLLENLKKRGACFLNAGQTVAWFRKRRAAAIDEVTWVDGEARVKTSKTSTMDNLPGLRIRVHKGQGLEENLGSVFSDMNFDGGEQGEKEELASKSSERASAACQA